MDEPTESEILNRLFEEACRRLVTARSPTISCLSDIGSYERWLQFELAAELSLARFRQDAEDQGVSPYWAKAEREGYDVYAPVQERAIHLFIFRVDPLTVNTDSEAGAPASDEAYSANAARGE